MPFYPQLTAGQLSLPDPNGRVHRKKDTGFIRGLRTKAQRVLLSTQPKASACRILMGRNRHLQLKQI